MLTTWILYHIFCLLSTVNFIFLKFFLIVCFSKTIICDSSVIIPLGVMLVNHKIQIFLDFLEVYLKDAIFLLPFAGGATAVAFSMREYAGGRPSQSSVARRPSPCTPTLLGTEGVLRCCVCCVVDFCLYAAVFRVGRCADLGSWVLRHL